MKFANGGTGTWRLIVQSLCHKTFIDSVPDDLTQLRAGQAAENGSSKFFTDGDPDEAASFFADSFELWFKIEHYQVALSALCAVGEMLVHAEKPALAEPILKEVLRYTGEFSDDVFCHAASAMGALHSKRDQFAAATEWFTRALAMDASSEARDSAQAALASMKSQPTYMLYALSSRSGAPVADDAGEEVLRTSRAAIGGPLFDQIATLECNTRWKCVHKDALLVVVEVSEGIRRGRSQFVEVQGLPAGVATIAREEGATELVLPQMLQIRSRVAECSGDFYDPDPQELRRTIDVVLNDFQLFGSVRIHPFHYVTATIPSANVSDFDLETLVLTVAYIADKIELTLSRGESDQF